MGNPLNAVSLNAIGGLENLELEWNGRQLSAVTRNTQRYEYSYDSNGMRTEIREYKNGSLETVCHYAWQNGKLVGLDIRDGLGEVRFVVKMIYDDAGESTGYIIFDEENSKQDVMHFQKNLQGDITGVFCESYGSEVLTYKYDAWGNITPQVTGGGLSMLYWGEIALLLTPITYRGYMYDPYIGMYYLQSRYYNPAYGRFLNADAIIKTGKSLGANIFAYCENNPVNYVDYDGRDAKTVITNILYLLVVIAVMKNDGLLDEFDYIFEQARSIAFNLSQKDFGFLELSAYFICDSGDDFKMYTVHIAIASIEYIDKIIKDSLYTHLEDEVYSYFSNIILSIIGDILPDFTTIILINDHISYLSNKELLELVDFLEQKKSEATSSGFDYVVFVNYITEHYTTIFDNIKTKTIYSCIGY